MTIEQRLAQLSLEPLVANWPDAIRRWRLIVWLVLWLPVTMVLGVSAGISLWVWLPIGLSNLTIGRRPARVVGWLDTLTDFNVRCLAFLIMPGTPAIQLLRRDDAVISLDIHPRGGHDVWIPTSRWTVARVILLPIAASLDVAFYLLVAIVMIPLLFVSAAIRERWPHPGRQLAAWNLRLFAEGWCWALGLDLATSRDADGTLGPTASTSARRMATSPAE